MSRRIGSLVAVVLALASAPTAAQWLDYLTPGIPRMPDGKPNLSAPAPKTADGKPDLSGLWMPTRPTGGIAQLNPSEIKPWALKLAKEREETLSRDFPPVHCLPNGGISGLAKFIQTPGLIVMLNEDLSYRQIFLDGRDLPKDPNPAWMGYSAGRWEGDTLVVESTGYNDRTWLERGYPHTENMRITERFHRGDFGHLMVDMTYSDPEVYEKPWTARMEMQYRADTDLLEYVCENEKDSVHLVGALSDDTNKAVNVAPEILSKYVGTYLRPLSGGRPPQEYIIALADGGLTLTVNGQTGPMVALSNTTFTRSGTHFELGKNDNGDVMDLIIHLAEGDVRCHRKK
jgi:hypothetical protein